ncbi:MAG TPA: hypothetical protein PKK43_15575, partial [Spirochaetota bacterium]|nr:hypothetical protein [Spirochaetota bacterium]
HSTGENGGTVALKIGDRRLIILDNDFPSDRIEKRGILKTTLLGSLLWKLIHEMTFFSRL